MNDYQISVYDNFLTDNELKFIREYLKDSQWHDQWSRSENERSKFDRPFGMFVCTEVEFFNLYLINKIKKYLNINQCEIERIYFNRQTFEQNGMFHTDGCDRTVLVYISEYDYEWGGFTQIKTRDEGYKFIIPIQKRMVSFPGMFLHKGFSYSYSQCPPRISLAYKLNNIE